MEEELYQAGWKGFLTSIHAYAPQKGEFLTYATHYIDGEMLKERVFALNLLGLTERVTLGKDQDKAGKFAKISKWIFV